MANSDNVLRGGLTRKRVDADELLRVVDFRPAPPRLVAPAPGEGAEQVYATPAAEFRLSRLALRGRWNPGPRSAIELWVADGGRLSRRRRLCRALAARRRIVRGPRLRRPTTPSKAKGCSSGDGA